MVKHLECLARNCMMNIEEMKCNVDHLLADRGLTTDYQEPSVRLLLYHLYVAMDIYRYMTSSEKNKAGFWYRTFKSSYRLTGFLKERKRKRDKEKSPLHPSYKEKETEVKEKAQKMCVCAVDAKEAFHQECLKYVGQYDTKKLTNFYLYWSEEDGKGRMRFQNERYWNIEKRLKLWTSNQYSSAITAADIHLERAKGKQQAKEADTAEQKRQAAEREDANERLFLQIEENKKGAVSYEEYLKMKH